MFPPFRTVLMKRLRDCMMLNHEYQKCFQRTKERLRENPEERQFEFRSVYVHSIEMFALS